MLAMGCDDSKNPLSSPADSSPDKQLIGIWQHDGGTNTTYYLVGYLGGEALKNVMRVVIATREKDGKLQQPEQGMLFPTALEGTSYLNLAAADQNQLAKVQDKGWQSNLFESYFILKYRVEGDVLLVWPIEPDTKKKAIKAGTIKGEIKNANGGRSVRFTDTTENLARFVAESEDELFAKEPLRFQRVK
jgi:hypothetical protein